MQRYYPLFRLYCSSLLSILDVKILPLVSIILHSGLILPSQSLVATTLVGCAQLAQVARMSWLGVLDVKILPLFQLYFSGSLDILYVKICSLFQLYCISWLGVLDVKILPLVPKCRVQDAM